MPPKAAPKGRTLAGSQDPNFAVSAYQTIMSKDNRSVVTAIGLFAVSHLLRPEALRRELLRTRRKRLRETWLCADNGVC